MHNIVIELIDIIPTFKMNAPARNSRYTFQYNQYQQQRPIFLSAHEIPWFLVQAEFKHIKLIVKTRDAGDNKLRPALHC